MAAPTQTDANKAAMAINSVVTSEGVYMTPLAGVLIGSGTGTPNGEVTAPIGSLFIELGSHELWMNTDASTTWEIVGTQS